MNSSSKYKKVTDEMINKFTPYKYIGQVAFSNSKHDLFLFKNRSFKARE